MPKVNQVVPIGGTQYDAKSIPGHHLQTPTHVSSSHKDDTFSLTTMDRRFSVTTGKTLSDSVTSQTILKKQVFGSNTIVGLLEKIPLSLKLILVVIFAILSLCVFGALLIVNSVRQIESARQIQSLSEISVLFSDIVHSLQRERGSSSIYLGSSGTLFVQELASYRNETDAALKAYLERTVTLKAIIPDSSSRYFLDASANLDKIQVYIDGLQVWRQKITNLQFPVAKVALDYFTNWNTAIIDTLIILSSQSSDSEFAMVQTVFNTVTELKEITGIKRAIGSNGFTAKALSTTNYNYFLQIQAQGILLQRHLKLLSSQSTYSFYETTVMKTQEALNCEIMESYLIQNYQSATLYSSTQWFNNMTIFIDAMRDVENYLRKITVSHANNLTWQATGSLIAFSVSTFFVTCLSTCIAIIFSKTIVGPWQRILALQEDTVYKFVPKEFLSILNKDKITDLKYGDFFEMELDIMFVDIRNYTGISENLQTKKIFKLLNKYLKNVGPIIRKHNGYIDKYLGDGFVALFLEPGHAVNAAIEIQMSLKLFNEALGHKYPHIAVGMGIARGMVAVGLIGESRRMDATIISDSVNLSARLESLTKQLNAHILVTKQIIDTTPMVRESFFRKIGNIAVVGKNQGIQVYEVIPFDDSPKKNTKDLFEKAMDHLYDRDKFNIGEAISLLKQILTIDPEDELCKMRLITAESLLNDCSQWTYCDRLTKK
ncbi:hypothetical protein C9374_011351 [Naegleria lovaniensis]|uniref:Guanylate cyclase domain-containing protein n=1 Tax=Naegleria lovaniensis TaxID=51637 RepID=A0AA88H245_NAELO|nr:uncharacterized protein C9374_011351 [Naegleria lovaniensis]KAG2392626.1 hypothetical protein C9374_011351 [Naegleria lovaniensis]